MTGPDRTPRARPSFAHASEAELARILDFYDVRWAYEPDTFPIGWSLDGDVVESFSPDFYLPDLELYVELTTLKQKLVRKKNRKLRRLRELYPDVRIKLFYARDFRMLLLKFGRLALSEELTGTTGQATPPRIPAEAGSPDAARVVRRSCRPPTSSRCLPRTRMPYRRPPVPTRRPPRRRSPPGRPTGRPPPSPRPAISPRPARSRPSSSHRRRRVPRPADGAAGAGAAGPAGDPAAGQTAGAPLDPGSP